MTVEEAELGHAVRHGATFVCNSCGCGEQVMYHGCAPSGELAVILSCPHIMITIVGDHVDNVVTKGVRH